MKSKNVRKLLVVIVAIAVLVIGGVGAERYITSKPYHLPSVKTRPVETEAPVEEAAAEVTEEAPVEEIPAEEEIIEEAPVEEAPVEEIIPEAPAEEEEISLDKLNAEEIQPEPEVRAESEPKQPAEKNEDTAIATVVALKDTLLYADPDGSTAGTVPASATMSLFGMADGWARVEYNGAIGYVLSSDIAVYMADEEVNQAAKEEKIRTISFYSDHAGKGVKAGETITLYAVLEGFEDDTVKIWWQYTPDNGATVIDAPGATGMTYSFVATHENIPYLWRVCVEYTENEVE